MQEIQIRDAKANLSAVIDHATQGEPSIITRHGKPTAVVLSYEEYRRLSAVPSFGRLLMSIPDGIETERDGEGLRDVAF